MAATKKTFTDLEQYLNPGAAASGVFPLVVSGAPSWIGGQYGTSFPGSPTDGLDYYYQADAANGVIWHFRYNSAETTYKWEFVGGPPMYAEVVTDEALGTGAAYVALATAGPSIALPRAGDYDVTVGMVAYDSSGASFAGQMSYDIGGTGAVDADAVVASYGGAAFQTHQASNERKRRKTGLTAVTLTSKYKGNITTGRFFNRWMSVTPVRVI